MPFSITCFGNDDYHYSIGHVSTIGDVFDIQQAMGRISGGVTDPIGTLRSEVQGAIAPSDDYVQETMNRAGRITDLHVLEVGFASALPLMHSLRLSIAGRNPGWVNSESGFAEHVFHSGDPDAVRSFLIVFGPMLEYTGLNGLGVLSAIGDLLVNYAYHGALRVPESGIGFNTGAHFQLTINLAVI